MREKQLAIDIVIKNAISCKCVDTWKRYPLWLIILLNDAFLYFNPLNPTGRFTSLRTCVPQTLPACFTAFVMVCQKTSLRKINCKLFCLSEGIMQHFWSQLKGQTCLLFTLMYATYIYKNYCICESLRYKCSINIKTKHCTHAGMTLYYFTYTPWTCKKKHNKSKILVIFCSVQFA